MLFEIERVLAIISQIKSGVTDWLSNSGKGDKEVCGTLRNVVSTVRGISIVLNNGKRVCWRMGAAIASRVLSAF